jgi:hypothetical protein
MNLFRSAPVTNVNPPTPEGASIELPEVSKGLKSTIVSYIFRPLKRLNPFNWFLASSEAEAQFSRFMGKQNELITQDNRFYPFTQINPHASWFERFRIHYFGETTFERDIRIKLREVAWNEVHSLSVKQVQSIPVSPQLASVGLGIPNLPSGSLDFPLVSEWANQAIKKISSIPSTPGSETPVNTPSISNPFEGSRISEALSRLSNSPDSITDNISASPPLGNLSSVDTALQNRVDSLPSPSPKDLYDFLGNKLDE